jgi:hypothetical protein
MMRRAATAAGAAVCAAVMTLLWRRQVGRRHDAKAVTGWHTALSALLEGEAMEVWAFKAEGAANITFSYVGRQPLLQGRVLRVRKTRSSHHGVPEPAAAPASDGGNGRPQSRLQAADPLEFATTVMRSRIGERYVVPGVSIPVSATFLSALGQYVLAGPPALLRPLKRRADGVDTTAAAVTLMVDHAVLPGASVVAEVGNDGHKRAFALVGPSLCIELKPKCALPAPGSPACRYCMHQVQKGVEAVAGDNEEARRDIVRGNAMAVAAAAAHVSGYCPLDLYSGEPARVAKALWAMADSPQNNFRLFVDGNLAYASELLPAAAVLTDSESPRRTCTCVEATPRCQLGACIARFVPQLATVPTVPLDGVAAEHVPVTRKANADAAHPSVSTLLGILTQVLLDDGVLASLQVAQAVHGPGDGLSPVPAACGQFRVDNATGRAWQTYLRHAGERGGADAPSTNAEVKRLAAAAPAVEASLVAGAQLSHESAADGDAAFLRAYLAAATAKDCSVMVACRLATWHAAGGSNPVPAPAASGGGAGDAAGEGPAHWARSLPLPAQTAVGSVASPAPGGAAESPPAARGAVVTGPATTPHPTHVVYSVAVVDLDPKPLARVPHYAALEAGLAATFMRAGPPCSRRRTSGARSRQFSPHDPEGRHFLAGVARGRNAAEAASTTDRCRQVGADFAVGARAREPAAVEYVDLVAQTSHWLGPPKTVSRRASQLPQRRTGCALCCSRHSRTAYVRVIQVSQASPL